MNIDVFNLILGVIVCAVMSILSYTGKWKPNRFGTGTMWIIILFLWIGLKIWFK